MARPPEGEPALVWRCLGVFNVLFALETVTDLIYLWGGCALPEGMSYASYAHRGAYPLVVTALLSAGLTLYFFPPGRRAERDPVARLLADGWIYCAAQCEVLSGSRRTWTAAGYYLFAATRPGGDSGFAHVCVLACRA
ncbi:MAG: DUF4153 domain-containing protein [Kiritimatiellia bacterium]